MPQLYLTGFNAFELRDASNNLTNQELNGSGELIGWNTDAPDGTGQSGQAAAQQWVNNNYTITLTSLGQIVQIDDPGDLEFADDDGDQVLGETVTFGGETYPAGAQIEGEFHIFVRDPTTGAQWTFTGVSFGGSGGNGFQTIEALAIVGNSTDGLPPLNRPLEIFQSIDLAPGQLAGDTVDYSEYAPCFAHGALILTPGGYAAVETLKAGDLVTTVDHGPRPILWAGSTTVRGDGRFAPVRIGVGVLGATAPLLVSPQHRVLISSRAAELMFGLGEALVKARDLTRFPDVETVKMDRVSYRHLLFDRHELVTANGVATESYQPSARNAAGFDDEVRDELFALFPELRKPGFDGFPAVRPSVRPFEARALELGALS